MARRDKSTFGERHLLAAIAAAPRSPKGYERYARWLRGQGKPILAEAQDVRAEYCTRIDFNFDWEKYLGPCGATSSPGIGETVTCFDVNGWGWSCDTAELQAWFLESKRGPDDLAEAPGSLEGPTQEVLRRLWTEGVSEPQYSEGIRRVRGQLYWCIQRVECPLEGEYFVLGA